jgi:hypothetical protein
VVQNLVPNDARHLKALLAGDRVDDQIAVDTDEMLRVEDTVLILANGQLSAGVSKAASDKRAKRSMALVVHVHFGSALGWGGEHENLAYLASGVDNLGSIVLVLPTDHLAKRILNSGIVAIDKVPVDELDRHTRLAWSIRR